MSYTREEASLFTISSFSLFQFFFVFSFKENFLSNQISERFKYFEMKQ